MLTMLFYYGPRCDVRYNFCINTMFGSSLTQLYVGGLMSYLRYLYLLAHSGVVFLLCFSSSMLPVSLDCPILISPSVFANVYSELVYLSRDIHDNCPVLH
jgi:hypothetical protein